MALPRYQGGQVALGKSGAAMAHKAQANTIDTFVQGIQGIKRGAIQTVEQQSIAQAKIDAEKAFTERGLKAEVNQDMTVYGQQYTNTINSLQEKQVAIDTGKRFEQLYQKHKDNLAAFEEISEAYRTESMKKMPPNLQAKFTIDFEANKAHYSGAVSKNSLDKIKSQDRALTLEVFTDSSNKATQAMRDHNQALAMHEMTKAIQTVEDSYVNGNIDLSERDKYIQKIYFDTSKANFKGVNDGFIERNDLSGAQDNIDTFRKTKIDGFSDEQRERLADEMQGDLNREINKKNTSSSTSQRLDNENAKELIYLQENGQDVEIDRLTDALNSNISEPVREDLANSINDYNQMLLFNSLNLSQQVDMIDEIDKRKNKSKDDFRLQIKMSKAFQASRKAIKEDGLSYSQGKAFDEPIETVDFSSEDSYNKRISQIEKATTYTGVQQPFYTKGELDSLKLSLPSMTPSSKAELSATLRKLPEGIQGATFSKLGGVFAVAGNHVNSEVSTNIFSGEELLKSKIIVPKSEVRTSISANIKEALGVASTENRADATKAIEAYMAHMADQSGSTIDAVSIDDAIKAVLGERIITQGNYNPFVENKETFPPYPDVTADEFFDWKENLKREDFGGEFGTMTMREADILKNGDFVFAGNGKYQIMIGNSIARYTDKNGEEQPFIVKYKK